MPLVFSTFRVTYKSLVPDKEICYANKFAKLCALYYINLTRCVKSDGSIAKLEFGISFVLRYNRPMVTYSISAHHYIHQSVEDFVNSVSSHCNSFYPRKLIESTSVNLSHLYDNLRSFAKDLIGFLRELEWSANATSVCLLSVRLQAPAIIFT